MWVIFYVKWHDLSREEQQKYYEKARTERQKHMEMYPHWNARDNYRFGLKKKKRKRDKADDPGTKAFFLFDFYSGMPWPKMNRLNTMTWPNVRGKCIGNCIQAGRPGTTMPNTKRNAEKGTKLEQTAMLKVVSTLHIVTFLLKIVSFFLHTYVPRHILNFIYFFWWDRYFFS